MMQLNKGFTVLELLIAFSLSMVVFISLIQLITSEKIHYAKQQQIIDIQEAAQAATLIFQGGFDELKSSAVSRCKPELWLNHTDVHRFNLLSKGNQWAIRKNTKNKLQFVLQHWKTPLISLSQPMSTLRELQVKDVNGIIKKNNPIVVTDCELAEIATVTAVHHKKDQCIVSLKEPLSHVYGGDKMKTWIAPLLQETYYVEATGRYNNVGQPISALYVKTIVNDVHELVPGIMDMHLQKKEKGVIHFQMNITSLEAIKSTKVFSFSKKLPLWIERGRLHLLWDIILRMNHG